MSAIEEGSWNMRRIACWLAAIGFVALAVARGPSAIEMARQGDVLTAARPGVSLIDVLRPDSNIAQFYAP